MDLSPLHPFLKTKAEASKIIQILEGLDDDLFKENFNLDKALSQNTTYDVKEALKKTLQEAKINTAANSELRPAIASLLEEVSKLPIIHMILALSPNEETVNAIHNWFYENYKKIVLLDISIDKAVIAGSVISFKGRANDYSLATRIDQMKQG